MKQLFRNVVATNQHRTIGRTRSPDRTNIEKLNWNLNQQRGRFVLVEIVQPVINPFASYQ